MGFKEHHLIGYLSDKKRKVLFDGELFDWEKHLPQGSILCCLL